MRSARGPSLHALRAFEAAARRLSFTAAAHELHVSQAAISRHVRGLESQLAAALFVRLTRRVELTPAGRELAAVLTRCFVEMQNAVLKASGDGVRTLRLSVEPSFGALWLAPRLGSFAMAHPRIELQLETSDTLRRPGSDADIAIRYAIAGSRRRIAGIRLFDMRAFPVIGRVRGGRSQLTHDAAVRGLRLLHDDDGRTWRAWFRAAGLEMAAEAQQQFFTDYSLTLAAAERGQGVTLAAPAFVAPQLRSGRLLRVGTTSIPFGTYWLLQSRDRQTEDLRRRFCAWLVAELASTPGSQE
jgi:LysR family transcriptional regulator, glycine cleavage system transcriptional activator